MIKTTKKKSHAQVKMVILFTGLSIAAYIVVSIYSSNFIYIKPRMKPHFETSSKEASSESETAIETPPFVFYVRLTTHHQRTVQEYRAFFIRSMKLFVPNRLAKLLVVLDKERPEDHQFGEAIKKQWPYPDICYSDPGDTTFYRGSGRARMYWDMLHPDLCTTTTYVGFLDSDTFFDTLLTPQLLFENQKPVIIAKAGPTASFCWSKATEKVLGKKEVLQCMSTFPVTVKTEHMKEMRKRLSRQFGTPFGLIFKDATQENYDNCICQFSIMCNYVWYYHRDEYAWHIQMVPNGDWNGVGLSEGQADSSYFRTEVKPEMKLPFPRSSIHLRYTLIDGVMYDHARPPKETLADIVREGLCFSAGFQYCPEQCKKWNQTTTVQYHLYSFEFSQWLWDKRCKEEQDKHYKNVKKIVDYHVKRNEEIFGLTSINDLCNVIEDWIFLAQL